MHLIHHEGHDSLSSPRSLRARLVRLVARWPLLLAATSLMACGQCTSCAVRSASVGGDYPFVRCVELEAPDRSWKHGSLSLAIDDRELTIEGVKESVHMAAFRGPAPGRAPFDKLEERLKGIEIAWVFGDVGDEEETALANLRALASSKAMVFVLAGSRDDAEILHDAFAELSENEAATVIDARGLKGVTIGAHRFDLLSGGLGGRYARNERACGYEADDLEGRWDDAPSGQRILMSWMAPVAPGFGAIVVGDPTLARLAREGAFHAVLSAWPAQMQAPGLTLVPRLGGPAVERADGSRLSGLLRFELHPEGLAGLPSSPPASTDTPESTRKGPE